MNETLRPGKEKVRYAVYDFNPPYRGGHGGRWVADRFLEIYEPLPRDFDPRYATAA